MDLSRENKRLLQQVEEYRRRMEEAEETLRAIRQGEVDALVVSGEHGEQVFTLKDADRPYRMMIEEMKEGAITMKANGEIIFSNRCFAEMVRMPLELVIGRAIFPLIDPQSQLVFEILLGEGLKGHGHGEISLKAGDGTTIPVYLAISSLPSEDVMGVCMVVTDLTAQKRNESLAANLPSVLMRYDKDLRVIYLSRSAEEFTGIPVAEFIGKTNREVGMPERLCDLWENAIQEVFRTGENRDLEFDFSSPGGTRSFYLKLAAERGPDGVIVHVVGVSTEITERKRLEESLKDLLGQRERLLESEQAARAEAEAANRAKDEFLATLSHELRTPLNAILGWLYLLKSEGTTPEDLREGLETIERSTRAQAQLVEDILDVSRIIMGKVRLEVKEVDLPAVIEAAVDAVQPAAEAKEIRLLKVLDSRASPVHGDPARLQQVVWNLLTNAVKFTPRGGKVEVLLERSDSTAKLTVRDTGLGISQDFLPHVFERFRQADASVSRKTGGLGLGLAIVRHLVELHGGTVNVESEGEGKGATFTVLLPLAAARIPRQEKPDEEAAMVQGRKRRDPPCLKGVKVLVVDDEEETCLIIRRILEKAEAQVETARSSAEGLEKLRQVRPEVLVSDIGMPGEDGYVFLAKAREQDAGKDRKIPAIALTAYARPDDRRRAFEAGYQVHVAKPVNPDELIAAVASLSGWTRG